MKHLLNIVLILLISLESSAVNISSDSLNVCKQARIDSRRFKPDKETRKNIRKVHGDADLIYFSPVNQKISDTLLLNNPGYICCYRQSAKKKRGIRKAVVIVAGAVAAILVLEYGLLYLTVPIAISDIID